MLKARRADPVLSLRIVKVSQELRLMCIEFIRDVLSLLGNLKAHISFEIPKNEEDLLSGNMEPPLHSDVIMLAGFQIFCSFWPDRVPEDLIRHTLTNINRS